MSLGLGPGLQVDIEDIRGAVLLQGDGQHFLYLSNLWNILGSRTSGNLSDGGGAQKLTGIADSANEGLQIEEEGLIINCLQHFPLLVG